MDYLGVFVAGYIVGMTVAVLIDVAVRRRQKAEWLAGIVRQIEKGRRAS